MLEMFIVFIRYLKNTFTLHRSCLYSLALISQVLEEQDSDIFTIALRHASVIIYALIPDSRFKGCILNNNYCYLAESTDNIMRNTSSFIFQTLMILWTLWVFRTHLKNDIFLFNIYFRVGQETTQIWSKDGSCFLMNWCAKKKKTLKNSWLRFPYFKFKYVINFFTVLKPKIIVTFTIFRFLD